MGSDVRPYLSLLASKEEDRFTEYLGQLLQDPHILRAFVSKVCGVETQSPEMLIARTQITVPGGRPDLAIRDPGATYLLFEVKLGSWLHDDQLSPYADALLSWLDRDSERSAHLFLICPGQVLPQELEDGRTQIAGKLGGDLELSGIPWETIASFFRQIANTTTDARLGVHTSDFAELIEWRLEGAPRSFTAEETALLSDPLAAQAINAARRLVHDLRTAVEEMLSENAKMTVSYGQDFDGYRLVVGDREWWFGFWLDAWEKIGISPLFLQLSGWQGGPALEVPEHLPLPVVRRMPYGERLLAPLTLESGVEPPALLNHLARIICDYCEQVPESGKPTS